MRQFQRGRLRDGRFELDQPCRLEPRFRYRVVLVGKDCARDANGAALAAWVTNDLGYARLIAMQINVLAACERAGVEAWNRAAAASQSRWVRLRPKSGRE